MLRHLIVLAVLAAGLASVPVAGSADVVPGTTDTATGHVFRNGLWWLGNDGYSRQLVQSAGYTSYYCGRAYYYPGAYSWQYSYVKSKEAVPAAKPPVVGWRVELLRAATKKAEQEREDAAYERAVKLLGLENVASTSFRSGYNYGNAYSLNYQSGATVYGLQAFRTAAELYGRSRFDAAPGIQAQGRVLEQMVDLVRETSGNQQSLLQQAIEAQARDTKSLAEGLAAAVALQAAKGAPSSVTVTTQAQAQGSATGGTAPAVTGAGSGAAVAFDEAAYQRVATANCAKCHGDDVKDNKSKFKLGDVPALSREDSLELLGRLRLPVDNKDHMPYGKAMLSDADYDLFAAKVLSSYLQKPQAPAQTPAKPAAPKAAKP